MTHYVTRAEIEQFAEGRETSPEICRAILELAGGYPERAERVWSDPTAGATARVLNRAWELAAADTARLCWGVETFVRDVVSPDEIMVDVFAGPAGAYGFRTGKWPVTVRGRSYKIYESVLHALDIDEQANRVRTEAARLFAAGELDRHAAS